MPDEPASQMIRVPTLLVDAVRELSRLHRTGRTKAVLDGIERLIAAIDSETDIDIDSISEMISALTKRLERLESRRDNSKNNIDINNVIQPISERLEKVEADIGLLIMTAIDLNARVSKLEGVNDIDYAVTPLSEGKQSDDISADSNVIAEAASGSDITTAVEQIAETQPLAPLTQIALAKRLGCFDKVIEKHRKGGSKEQFAEWSRERDPESIAWKWEGAGGRGQPLKFVPVG